jgi:hypothetical protein
MRVVYVGFLENLFAPFGDFYAQNVAELFETSEQYHQHVANDEWFDTFGELNEEDKQAFVDWWFEHYQDEDFPYTWEDFREKYEGD